MILQDYLYFKKKHITDFSKTVPCTPQHLSGYMHGRIKITRRMATCISLATNGEIDVDTLMANNPLGKPRKAERQLQESLSSR